ncbi:uncharacterized protein PRCAT00005494001 [Priceomyces carsonii]|uniref:uncharacterized protein n=1 Tax=Priceomyces carsonii TaxID=28549 RepID=UPI002ED85C55|nr:unnamed protein product [Priceomyces carsonii]
MSEEGDKTKSPVDQKDDGLDRKTLFVRSIPYEATSDELSEFFSQFVPVKHAVIVNGSDGKSRGFGFVSFTLDDDTLTALVEARKTKFKGRLLRVDMAKRRDRKDKRGTLENRVPAEPVEKRRARLIIRNIPWSLKNPDDLKKIFVKYGGVFDAYIPKKKGGQMLGFAFVVMNKKSAADRAVKGSEGLQIHGREVAVDFAIEKSKWEQVKEQDSEKESEGEEMEEETVEASGEGTEKEKIVGLDNESHKEIEHKDSDSDSELTSEDEGDEDEEDENEDKDEDEVDEEDDSDEELEDAELEINDSKPDIPKKNRQEPFSIFVRNIPYDADAASLKEHFNRFGPVKYALPVIDKETGLAKGSAFVAFVDEDSYTKCLENAPSVASSSLLIADDVSPDYVYSGRILSVSSTVDRGSAQKLAERNLEKRQEILGKAPGEKDKRNLFLLNEGRITANSKLAQYISKTDLEMREQSYKLRVQQLKKNPTLHLSLTRLAIRNLPRAMNSKALKSLGRKAVVQFATEVKEEKRQPLSKEEVGRSLKDKKDNLDPEAEKKSKKKGVVRQAKVVQEVKGSGETGRSKGYGFVEFRDHKTALMGLRWLNAHEVSIPEILEGLTEEERAKAKLEGLAKRKLIVEFAIENAEVIKRRRDKIKQHRHSGAISKRRREEGDDGEEERKEDIKKYKTSKSRKDSKKKGNLNKGPQPKKADKSEVPDNVKQIIGQKRKKKKNKA